MLRAKEKGFKGIWIFLAVIVVAIAFLPYLWFVMTSFKYRTDILTPTIKLMFKPILSNYPEIFLGREFIIFLKNSVIVALGTVALSLAVGIPAAYSLSRLPVTGKKHIMFFILSTRMAPPITIAIPLYVLCSKVGILGSHPAVIISHVTFGIALVVWLMKTFFDDIPSELEESGRIDGCNRFGAFRYIMLPLSLPGIAVSALFVFVFSWNEFLFALILSGHAARTLPPAFPGLITPHGTFWGQIAAGATVSTLPGVFLVLFLHKYLVRGLTFGAIK